MPPKTKAHIDDCPLAAVLSQRLIESSETLTKRWLDRISARISLDASLVFPSKDLLDHVPLLIEGIAAYVANPAAVISSDMAVVAKARELGALRHAQGFDQYQILKEFEILGGMLLGFLGEVADESDVPCERSELMGCAQRVYQAVSLILQATSTQFLQLVTDKVGEREARLRAFNRALTHEFRNRIGASLGAAQILELSGLPDGKREELAAIIVRNVRGMRGVLDNLLELSRVDADSRQQRHVRLPQAAAEVRRELRDMAQVDGVTLRLTDLPDVEVAAAAVELCLTNLVSNAIKYRNPSTDNPWVEIRGRLEAPTGEDSQIVVEVADNGIGVPVDQRAQLFERFFRADNGSSEIDGTGLGLSIVRDAVAQLGGHIWADFPEVGSVFAFSLPCRRDVDAASGEPRGEPSPG
ncbi:MAG: sensor histidine kinase [Gemmatimonadaceae bacterium]